MRQAALILALLSSSAAADPFDVLHDTSIRWHYEVVHGKTPQALAKAPAAPTSTCKIDRITTDDVQAEAHLSCTADTQPTNGDMSFGGGLGLAVDQDHTITFDADGVREVMSGSTGAVLKDRFNPGGFRFPNPITSKVRLAKADLRIALDIAVRTVKVGSKTSKAWFETGWEGFADLKTYVAYAYIPGVGPYLQCVYVADDRDYWCLRLTAWEKTQGP